MRFERSAGILLHPTSLPGKYGIGDLGYEAFNFIKFLEASGQKLWQVFPLGPTGYGDSPYQCFSAFAGNPNLISPEKLRDVGFLSDSDLEEISHHDPSHVDYGPVIDYKKKILRKAFDNYKKNPRLIKKDLENFTEKNKDWLDDFS
ncbi:MAG: 4-alpha-glucanotransferase, partial [Ignavibacteriaceae bacterium]